MRKASNSGSRSSDFRAVFDQLKRLVQKAAAGTKLAVTDDSPDNYSLTAGYSERFKKDLWFGGVRMGKSYVSLHLTPVYMNAKLLDGMSTELRARMQGKSCFNFSKPLEPAMRREIGDLIGRCIRGFAAFGSAAPKQERRKHEAAKSRSGSRRTGTDS
jgi:hypothetical protein